MNTPKLRFKEFNDEYKSIKLKDVSEIYDGAMAEWRIAQVKETAYIDVLNYSN